MTSEPEDEDDTPPGQARQAEDMASAPSLPTAPSTNADESESVGYKRPPRRTRYRPGQSGNPRGRPKGARSLAAILKDVLRRKVSITENGKARHVPALEGLMHKMLSDALRGDRGAFRDLLSLLDRHSEPAENAVGAEETLLEDTELLARYGLVGPMITPPETSHQDGEPDAGSFFKDDRKGGETT